LIFWQFPDAQLVAEARCRFHVWQQRFEREFDSDRRPSALASSSLPLRAATVFSLLVTGIAVFLQVRSLSAAEAMAATRKFEREFYHTPLPLHQCLRVVVSQIAPTPLRHAGRVEVWAEPGGSRFSARWRDDRGVLRYGLWKPANGQEWLFDPRLAKRVLPARKSLVEVTSLALVSEHGLELEQIEAGFVDWLQSRRWQPIAFGDELAGFVDREDVVLRAERVRSENGEPSIRLSAHRQAGGGIRVEMVLELAAGTFSPRLQRIRFRNASREIELTLVVERAEAVAPYQVLAAVFRPDAEVIAAPARAKMTAPVAAVLPLVVTPAGDPRAEETPLEVEEIEAEYALHRAGACLGEPIEILRDRPGHIQIRGLAATAERKAELLGAMAALQANPAVGIDIRTVEEAAAQFPPGAAAGSTVTQTSPEKLPMEDTLERFFAPRGAGEENVRQKIADFATEAVSRSDQALEHGWALRRPSERHNSGENLAAGSRRLLEEMLRDHLAALRAGSEGTRQLLEPLLELAGGATNGRGDAVVLPARGQDPETSVLEVFDTVKRIDGLAQALFAGAELNGELVETAATELRWLCDRLARSLGALEARLGEEFCAEGPVNKRQ
jgi:hypothetical protein